MEGTSEPPTAPGFSFLEAPTFRILGLLPLEEEAPRPLPVPLGPCSSTGLVSGRESQSRGISRLPSPHPFQVPGTVPGIQ